MNPLRILFFGSTADSILVLERIFQLSTINHEPLTISAVVTQPPRPVGREKTVTPTPVEIWAKEHNIPVLSFPSSQDKPWLYENETTVIDTLQPFKADLLISACYGQKIPTATIASAKFGGLNVHPSLLPRWRGADPVPWAILSGDHQTGVTVVTLSEKFDEGRIVAQKKVPLTDKDYPDPLRTHLFTLGAKLLVETLPEYLTSTKTSTFPKVQPHFHLRGEIASHIGKSHPYARRLTRADGFEPWETLVKAMNDEGFSEDAKRIERKFRAFTPWPGLWTKVNVHGEEKRLKILKGRIAGNKLIIDQVQLEGKTPVSFSQFSAGYLTS